MKGVGENGNDIIVALKTFPIYPLQSLNNHANQLKEIKDIKEVNKKVTADIQHISKSLDAASADIKKGTS